MTKPYEEFMIELKNMMVQKVSELKQKEDARDKIEMSIRLLMGFDPDTDLTAHRDEINEMIQMKSVLAPALRELVKSYENTDETFTDEEMSKILTIGYLIDLLNNDSSSIDINDDGTLTIHDNPEFWKQIKASKEETTGDTSEEPTEETTEEPTEEPTEETMMESSSNQLAETYIKSANNPELRMVRLTWIKGVPVYRYFVTNTGFIMERIKDRICKKFPRKQLDEDRDLIIQLTDKKKAKVSHLVWEAFYPEFRNISYTLMYVDGDPNNCALSNLNLQLKKTTKLK